MAKPRPMMHFYFGPLGYGRRFVSRSMEEVGGKIPGFFLDKSATDPEGVPRSCLYPLLPDVNDSDLGTDSLFLVEVEEVMLLRAAFRYILSQEGDDLCWRDFYTVAAGVLPEKEAALAKLKSLPPASVMLHNCKKFVEHLCAGCEPAYVADSPEQIIAKQAERIKELEASLAKATVREW